MDFNVIKFTISWFALAIYYESLIIRILLVASLLLTTLHRVIIPVLEIVIDQWVQKSRLLQAHEELQYRRRNRRN